LKAMTFFGRTAILVAALAGGDGGFAEIIDRVAAVVGRGIITASEVDRELRLEAFCNRVPPPGRPAASSAEFRAALERLIRQRLLRLELEMTSFPPAPEAMVPNLAPGPASPGDYGLGEQEVREYAQRQTDTLRFVEARFGSSAEITPDEVGAFYEKTLLPQWRQQGVVEPPPLDSVRPQVERIVREHRANELLDLWLAEARARARVRVMEAGSPDQ